MKVKNRYMPGIFLSFLLLLLLWSAPVFAAGAIDTSRPVTLTIQYQEAEKVVSGVPFALYRVADVSPYGEYTVSDEFKNYIPETAFAGDDGRALAETLAGQIAANKIAPLDEGTTDAQGQLRFPVKQKELLPGMYLAVAQVLTKDKVSYTTEPFFVALPGADTAANDWNYDVLAVPKHTAEPVPDEPEKTSLKVLKVWKDEGYEKLRPTAVVVKLYQNGEIYGKEVTLTEANNWRYTWEDLPVYDSSGKKIDWKLTENTIRGYIGKVVLEKDTFTVTNTINKNETPLSELPGSSKLPQTGLLWWPVPLLAFAGVICLLLGRIFKRGRHE